VVCHDDLRAAVALHRFAQKPQRCLAISPFSDEHLKNLTLVIDGSPEVMRFTIDTDENFVQMPAPLDMGAN